MGLYLALWTLWFKISNVGNPAPGLFNSRTEAQNLECERVPVPVAVERYPGVVPPPDPRGDLMERQVLICSERLLPADLRAPQDEALLIGMEASAREIAALATASRPELKDALWLVESHTSNPQVNDKLSFATKNAMVDLGLQVSDRTPVLGFDDVSVITRLPPLEAWPAACLRYHQTGALGAGEALLASTLVDPRETQLHTGICAQGAWTWLR